ncbi:hypothetical protein AAG906_007921 [Vitis piasezkii]
MNQQVVTVDQFTTAMVSIQEALASLIQKIGRQQSRPPVFQDETPHDSLPLLPPPPVLTVLQASSYLLHGHSEVAPPAVVQTTIIDDGMLVASLLAKFRMPNIERSRAPHQTYDQAYMPRTLPVPPQFKMDLCSSVQTTTVVPLTFPYYSAQTPFVLILDVEKVRTPYVDDVHIPDIQNVILFSDDDLPLEGSDHTHPLYIAIGCSGRRVLSVLLDNGSTLNVYPLAIAIALGYAPFDFGPSTQTVRAYDNTRREVMSTLEIELLIGLTTFVTLFQISHSDDDLFLTGFTFDEVQTLDMEDFHRDFVAMLFDQDGKTMVLDIMRNMSYLRHGFMAIPDHDIPFGLGFIPTKVDYQYMTRLRKERMITRLTHTHFDYLSQMPSDGIIRGLNTVQEAELQRLIHWLQLSDGAPSTSTSALAAPSSLDRISLMTLYFQDEIDEHGIFLKSRHRNPVAPAPEVTEDVIVVADLFDGHVSPILDIDDDIARHDSDDDSSSASDLDAIDQRVSPATEHTKVVDFGTANQPCELKIGSDLFTDESDCLIQLLKSYLNIFRMYPEWLANVIPIPKKDGKMKVCVDFQDVNKANPKDDFPLPHIDMLVDSTIDHLMLSFMDGFFWVQSDPHGSRGHGEDRATTTLFYDMMHRDVEVYVDYMIMKSRDKLNHLVALEIFFKRIRQFRLRLNPKKCTFGVTSGKLLGYMVKISQASWVDFSTSVDSLPDCRTFDVVVTSLSGWRMYFDSMANHSRYEIGVLLISLVTITFLDLFRLAFLDRHPITNNIVEYGVCILGLETTVKLGIRQMEVFGDSNLVLRQIQDEWKTRDMKLRPYHAYLELLVQRFDDLRYTHLPKALNQFADALATLASMIDIHVEVWGINIIGKISPKSSSGHEFILVVIDYFTKWVEAASYARLTSSGVARATPYSLVYGMKVVLPVEIEMSSLRVALE